MKKRTFLLMPLSFATLAGCQVPTGAEMDATVQITAVVETVDQTAREVLLRGPEGRLLTVQVGPAVRNLAQLRPGNRVTATYYESFAANFAGRSGGTGANVTAGLSTAELGQRPGGEANRLVQARIRIEAVDTSARTVSFIGPRQALRVVKVRNPDMWAFARTLRRGDEVDITYAEAFAISVEPAAS